MPDDYYLVLGISREADPDQIKKAYRRVVKKYHPDIRPVKRGVEKLTEAREAYDTLRDAERRRRYDAKLTTRTGRSKRTVRPQGFRNPAPSARRRGMSCDSLVDAFFDGIVPEFYPGRGQGPIEKDLFLEVTLSPAEALHGGLFPMSVPVYEPCRHCLDGDPWEAPFCRFCNGTGHVRKQRAFSLSIPPRTPDGTKVKLSLEDIGLRGTFLHVFVRVSPFPP
jgi:molecular chaperone DnaJ